MNAFSLHPAIISFLDQFQSSLDFPDPLTSDTTEGIIAVGGKLDVGTLLHAYVRGIFPWPHSDFPNLWFCPDQRGILEFKNLHISRSLQKFRDRNPQLQLRVNYNIDGVIKPCSLQSRRGQEGTWINQEVISGYSELFKNGYAWTAECWDIETEKIIGGLYGVNIMGVISGESMFHLAPNVSKLSLWLWIETLMKLGYTWMDIQMVTPVLGQFGGHYVDKLAYLTQYLKKSQELWTRGNFAELS